MKVGDLVLGRGCGTVGIVTSIWTDRSRVVLWPDGRKVLCHINSLVAL